MVSSLLLTSPLVLAASRYVATTGSNSVNTSPNNCLAQASPCLTLQHAFSQMASGDTLIIANGAYSGTGNSLDTSSGSNFIPNGTGVGLNPYTIIKAATDGGVTIAAPFVLGTTSAYLQFEGLKINYSASGKNISGHHIKIFRTAFVGGPSTGNQINLGIGTNDVTPGANYILLEDVWSYGSGGRYNISVFNSTNVILRRVVIRHDPGWVFDNNNPEGGLIVYNSNHVELQNVIGIDLGTLNAARNGGIGVFHNESNANSLTHHSDNRYVGCHGYNMTFSRTPSADVCR